MRSVSLLFICWSLTHGLPLQSSGHDLQEWRRFHSHSQSATLQDDSIQSPMLKLLSMLLLVRPNMLRRSTLPRYQQVLVACSRTSSSLAMVGEDPSLRIQLFDPGKDRIRFPFPTIGPSRAMDDDDVDLGSSPIKYGFSRPIYLNMLNDLSDKVRDNVFMGHCLYAGDGEIEGMEGDSMIRSGTVGVATQVANIDIQPSPFNSDEKVGILSGTGAFRFEILKVESIFPYPSAYVRKLIDDPPEEDAFKLETEVGKALHKLVSVSRQLEARGVASQEADNMLEGPLTLLDAHQRAVQGGLYTDQRERMEAFSMGVCRTLSLPYDDSVECILTRSAKRRFEVLLEYLRPMLSEMQALDSIDVLDLDSGLSGEASSQASIVNKGVSSGMDVRPSAFGGTTSFTPIDLKLGEPEDAAAAETMKELDVPKGSYVEYWWDEQGGWFKAKVTEKIELLGEMIYTLEFDDGEVVANLRLYEWRTRRL